jgi:hypothetical protein
MTEHKPSPLKPIMLCVTLFFFGVAIAIRMSGDAGGSVPFLALGAIFAVCYGLLSVNRGI